MKMRDIKRGYRIVLKDSTGSQVGEVSADPCGVLDGKWSFVYANTDADGRWNGHLYWGPVVDSLDAELDESIWVYVESEPSPGWGTGYPRAYHHDFDGTLLDDYAFERKETVYYDFRAPSEFGAVEKNLGPNLFNLKKLNIRRD